MSNSITSANAIFTLSVPGVFTAPVAVQQFAVDEAFDPENPEAAEIQIGVDGYVAAGFLPTLVRMDLMLMASSATNPLLEAWDQAQQLTKELFPATGSIIIPSVSAIYTLGNGYLRSPSRVPQAKRVLSPRRWGLVWGSIVSGPYA